MHSMMPNRATTETSMKFYLHHQFKRIFIHPDGRLKFLHHFYLCFSVLRLHVRNIYPLGSAVIPRFKEVEESRRMFASIIIRCTSTVCDIQFTLTLIPLMTSMWFWILLVCLFYTFSCLKKVPPKYYALWNKHGIIKSILLYKFRGSNGVRNV